MYFRMLLLETSGDGLEKDRTWGRGMTLIKRNGKSQVLGGNEVGKKKVLGDRWQILTGLWVHRERGRSKTVGDITRFLGFRIHKETWLNEGFEFSFWASSFALKQYPTQAKCMCQGLFKNKRQREKWLQLHGAGSRVVDTEWNSEAGLDKGMNERQMWSLRISSNSV